MVTFSAYFQFKLPTQISFGKKRANFQVYSGSVLKQEKLKLRLKILEEGIKHVSSLSNDSNAIIELIKTGKATNIIGFLTSNGGVRKRSSSNPRASTFGTSPLQQPTAEHEKASGGSRQGNSARKKNAYGENMLRRSLWAARSRDVDSGEKETTEVKENSSNGDDRKAPAELIKKESGNEEPQDKSDCEDVVSGLPYDKIQKEVINLRKLCEVKENYLNDKDHEIQVK